jgi:hypothetical protein
MNGHERREFVRAHRIGVLGYKPDDVKGLTHDLGTSLPWDASPSNS